MTPTNLKTGRESLRPRANIIRVIGNELISDDSVAITELVKNSYDADATTVTLTFLNVETPESAEIVIADDGVGMSLETVRTAWMEPATSFKKENKRTDRGRRVLGEKGIGRFAAARLANKLEMITKQASEDYELWVALDWELFDRGIP